MNSWINWNIIASPSNWLIVIFVLIFMAYAAMTILSNANVLTLKV